MVPAYQRRYSWRDRQIYELIEDIELLEDPDVHLLGSIVCLTGHHTAGINSLELVDGQQRLTTLSILLECIKQRFIAEQERDQAQELARLLTAKALGGSPAPKIALDSIDAEEYRQLIDCSADDDKPLQNLDLEYCFTLVREWIAKQELSALVRFLYKLQNQALVIRLDVSDAKDAFKLFETINNRGLKLSPTDIIKNFILGNAARFDEAQLREARKGWALIIRHLDGTDTDAFFRYFLIAATHTRVTKSFVVSEFKSLFMNEVAEAKALPDRHHYQDEEEETDEEAVVGKQITTETPPKTSGTNRVTFKKFLGRIIASAQIYGQLVLAKTGDKRIDRHLRNLRMIKSAQTYGFLMHLRIGGIDDKSFLEILRLTESFVLRRHVCRERSNDTETLFAKLCEVNPIQPLADVKRRYRESCPEDDKFREEFANANFTSNIIDRARYCLERIELNRHGTHAELEVLGSEDVHVEHIIPQKIRTKKSRGEFGDWVEYLGDKAELRHSRLVSRIGNLTLFSGYLNVGASNNPFANKKSAF